MERLYDMNLQEIAVNEWRADGIQSVHSLSITLKSNLKPYWSESFRGTYLPPGLLDSHTRKQNAKTLDNVLLPTSRPRP